MTSGLDRGMAVRAEENALLRPPPRHFSSDRVTPASAMPNFFLLRVEVMELKRAR